MNNINSKAGNICPSGISAPIFEKQEEENELYTADSGEKLHPSAKDAVFAVVFIFLAWCYWDLGQHFYYVIGNPYCTFKYALFTVLFAGAVLLYTGKWRHMPKESIFWLCITLVLGFATLLPYSESADILYSANPLSLFHMFAFHFAVCYWALSVSGRLMDKDRTSNWLFFDLLNAMFIFPFGNFFRLPAVLWAWVKDKFTGRKRKGEKKNHRVLAVLIGVLLSLLCLGLILPLLFKADEGFSKLFLSAFRNFQNSIANFFLKFKFYSSDFIAKCFFILPTAFFLYGLAYGCRHGRKQDVLKKAPVEKVMKKAGILPKITVYTVLFTLCAVYLVFIAMQVKYLFSAFGGTLPQGFSYAEYARSGFFELCRVAVINLCIILAAQTFCRKDNKGAKILRVCNVLLSVLTILLLVTAAAKMGLYMLTYGLTVKRVLVSAFMLWIAFVFVLVIIRQYRPLNTLRLAVFTGAVIFTVLCVLPVSEGVESYNRYMGYDREEIMYY